MCKSFTVHNFFLFILNYYKSWWSPGTTSFKVPRGVFMWTSVIHWNKLCVTVKPFPSSWIISKVIFKNISPFPLLARCCDRRCVASTKSLWIALTMCTHEIKIHKQCCSIALLLKLHRVSLTYGFLLPLICLSVMSYTLLPPYYDY